MYTGWTITGPDNKSGAGTYTSYTNEPTGSYSISADDLDCYSKSISPSSGSLSDGGTLTFNISYTSTCSDPTPPPPPTSPGQVGADIKANGLDGPVSVSSGSAATISWNSSNASSCSVSPTGWTGTSGSQSSGSITSSVTYTLNCSGSGGSASDSVTVNPASAGSCGTMTDDSAIRGCTDYQEMSPVYQASAAACSAYCGSQGADSCEWNANGNCYVEYSSGGCYIQPGFSGWSAAVCGQTPPSETLTATIWSGSGMITGPGISCPGDCSEAFSLNSWVTVSAAGTNGYTLGGWGGDCNSQTNSCVLRMDANKNALATFSLSQENLAVATGGSGSGSVSSSPPGISCGSTCSANYSYGTSVTLTASPAAGSVFSSWTGDCGGTSSTCTLTMNGNKSAAATFASAFDYTLHNDGTVSVTKGSGNTYGQSVISRVLTAGVAQPITISASGLPSGVSYSVSNNPCSPNCSSTITFTVAPTAAVGTYTITVTGAPLGKTTTFSLKVVGAPIGVSCSVSPTTARLGETVTWTGTVSGGTAPYTYAWSGSSIPSSPAPSANPYTKAYTTTGDKTAQLSVTDGDGVESTCTPGTVHIYFDPAFKEF